MASFTLNSRRNQTTEKYSSAIVTGNYRRRSGADTVNTYLEKDYIEKVFRHLKTDEHIEPVRHRLERRVRVYIFLLVLSYRIASALHWKMSLLEDRNAMGRYG